MIRDEQFEVPGGRVHAIRVSTSSGTHPPLVLLHALGMDGRVFVPLMKTLSIERECIALDLRRHGRTTVEQELTATGAAADIGAVLNQLETPVDLLGLSLGGAVAQVVATECGTQIRRVVLVSTFSRLDPGNERLERHKASLADGASGIEWAERRAKVLHPQAPKESRELYIAVIASVDPARFLENAISTYAIDVREFAREINQPVMIIAGSEDDRVPMTVTEEMVALIPNGRLRVLPGGGHICHLDLPDVFATMVGRFLSPAP